MVWKERLYISLNKQQNITTMEFYIYLQNTKTGYKTYSMTTSIECEARNYCEEVEIETKGLLKAYYTTTWEG